MKIIPVHPSRLVDTDHANGATSRNDAVVGRTLGSKRPSRRTLAKRGPSRRTFGKRPPG